MNEDDPIENEGVKVVTINPYNFRRSRPANSEVSDEILPKFKLIHAFMICLVICKNEENPSKNEGTKVVTTFFPLYVYGDFSRLSRVANSLVPCRILQNCKLIQALMVVLVT